jgi:biopolymer transport protein ExbD
LKNPYTLTLFLLCASLPAAGCEPKPANFNEVVEETTDNANVVKLSIDPIRAMLVTVNAERKVFFKMEYVGTLDDTGPLKEKVRQAIEKKRQEECDAAGGNGNAETAAHVNTIFFCAPADFKYGDVVGALDAIKEVGGNPVGITGCDPPR